MIIVIEMRYITTRLLFIINMFRWTICKQMNPAVLQDPLQVQPPCAPQEVEPVQVEQEAPVHVSVTLKKINIQ
jgi:hypothetical protein